MTKKKTCTGCNKRLDISPSNFYYYKRKNGVYINSKCKECVKDQVKNWTVKNKERISRNQKKWRYKNKDDLRIYSQEYYSKNKDYLLETRQQYYINNKKQILHKNKEYRIQNKDNIQAYEASIKRKNTRNKRAKRLRKENLDRYRSYDCTPKRREAKRKQTQLRRKNDLGYRLRGNVSRAVRRAIFNNGKVKNGNSILRFLPYTIDELKNHLESQFKSWMSWDNYGRYSSESGKKWHIDHIISQASLPYDSMEHPNFIKCWSLNNLQPLDAIQNIKKGG